jgi:tripartite-type tricarboxylate transporter receptor subunit TctC
MPTFPNVPTVAESTLAGFEFVNWSALVAPRGAPQIIISKLQGETAKILGQADVKERLLTQGAEPTASTADELRNVMLRDSEIIGKLIKACPGCCCGQTCGGMCLE